MRHHLLAIRLEILFHTIRVQEGTETLLHLSPFTLTLISLKFSCDAAMPYSLCCFDLCCYWPGNAL